MLLLTFGNRHTVVVVLLSDAVPISGQPSLLRKPYFFFSSAVCRSVGALRERKRRGSGQERKDGSSIELFGRIRVPIDIS